MNIRATARDALVAWEKDGTYINLSVGKYVTGIDAATRAALTALIYGTVERHLTIDYYIGVLTGRSVNSLRRSTRALLRVGLYQLAFMDRTAEYAAVNETVSAALDRGEAAMVNAVMREYLRRGGVALPPRDKSSVRYISLAYSFPAWIVRTFISRFGEDKVCDILESFNSVRPLTLRVNTLRTTRDELLSELAATGIEAEPCALSEVGITVPSMPAQEIPGYEAGKFFVQNESSQLASRALEAKSGMTVVDVCACPGGKSFGAAIDMKNDGKIYCFDLRESKLSLIDSGAARLGIRIIDSACLDGRECRRDLIGRAQRVICDVPCSGLGVLGEKPDLRYRDRGSLAELPKLQYGILSSAANYLAPGGELVYSTCTVAKEENEDVFTNFLQEHDGFEPVDFSIGTLSSSGGMLPIMPGISGNSAMDGFFISKLRRKTK